MRTPAEVAADKRRSGRPPAAGQPRDKLIQIRVTAAELEKLKKRTRKAGISLTEFLRRAGGIT